MRANCDKWCKHDRPCGPSQDGLQMCALGTSYTLLYQILKPGSALSLQLDAIVQGAQPCEIYGSTCPGRREQCNRRPRTTHSSLRRLFQGGNWCKLCYLCRVRKYPLGSPSNLPNQGCYFPSRFCTCLPHMRHTARQEKNVQLCTHNVKCCSPPHVEKLQIQTGTSTTLRRSMSWVQTEFHIRKLSVCMQEASQDDIFQSEKNADMQQRVG